MIGGRFGGVLRAAQQGDDVAFDELWRDLNPSLLRYLRALTAGTPADAEGLAVDTWVEVTRRLNGFRGDEVAWRAWVLRRARRRMRRDLRRLHWAQRPDAEPDAVPAGDGGPSGSSASGGWAGSFDGAGTRAPVIALRPRATLQDVVLAFALELVEALPPLDREVLVLRAAGGLPVDEVARIVGRGRQSVRALGHRAAVAIARAPQWGASAPVAAAALHASVEAVLAGEPVGDGAAVEVLRLGDVTTALAAPGTPVELVGSGPAYAAFARHAGAAAGLHRARRPAALLGTRLASGAAAVAIALGGTAAAAYAGALPDSLQEVAHQLFRAPAPHDVPPAPPAPSPSVPATAPTGAGSGALPSAGAPADGTPRRGHPHPSRAVTPPAAGTPGADDGSSAGAGPGVPSGAVTDAGTTADAPSAGVPSSAPSTSDGVSATPSDPATGVPTGAPSSSSTPTPSPTTVHGRPSTHPAGPPSSGRPSMPAAPRTSPSLPPHARR